MAKNVGFIGSQVRHALNDSRGFVSGEELSAAIFQASMAVFSHFRGHPALYRPGQPLPPRAYQLTDVIDVALHPFLRLQLYDADPQGQAMGAMAINAEGIIQFPVAKDLAGKPTLENSFQHPTAIYIDGARKITEVNDNAVQQREANSITAPTNTFPIRSSVPDGYRIRPLTVTSFGLQYLAAPPRPVFAEKPTEDGFDVEYDDDNSVDVGWTSVTAINEIIAHATRILGKEVGDQAAVGLATQTVQLGA